MIKFNKTMTKFNLQCHLQQILLVQMSMKTHFGNHASLTYLPTPLLLFRNIEKLDEPWLLSCFSANAFHVPEV